MNTYLKTIGLIFPAHLLVINKYNLFIIILFSAFSCSSIKNQQEYKLVQYDDLTKKNVYIVVEKMPVYKKGEKDFLDDFIKSFDYDYSLHLDENIQTMLRLQFVIDSKGHLIGARIYDKKPEILTNFEKAGLKALVLLQSWEAGKHNGKNVNVILTRIINVDYNNR
ncbi:MAG: hypothetical protein QM751_10240 [Paludibacteraceae bacterium]